MWNSTDLAFVGAPLPSSELEGFVPLVFLKGMRKEKGLLRFRGKGREPFEYPKFQLAVFSHAAIVKGSLKQNTKHLLKP